MASDLADPSADVSDPGARLLVRIGDFVEPLTRFDRSHLTLAGSEHKLVEVMARQVFRVGFEIVRSEGNGALPQGVTALPDALALSREIDAQLAASRAAVPGKLAHWAEDHGEDPATRPAVEDCFTRLPPLGCTETCGTCTGAGKVNCSVCHGAKDVTCATCDGRGATRCQTCAGGGQVNCAACKGQGARLVQKERKVWDDAIDAERIERYQEMETCSTCTGSGKVSCGKCSGRGEITCARCQGRKVVTCARCSGSGTETCQACDGQGKRYKTAVLTCSIKETFEATPRTAEPDIVEVLKGLGDIDAVLGLSTSTRAVAEANNDTLRRDTLALTPVTSAVIAAGGQNTTIRGFGARQDVRDYRNLAGLLLAGDLDVMETALIPTRRIPPRVTPEMMGALSDMLLSEANYSIAAAPPRKTGAEMEREFKGVVAGGYIARAAEAMRKGTSRAYWSALMRGPMEALAAPIVIMPLDLFVRAAGIGARTTLVIACMIATFGAAWLGHVYVVRQLQQLLLPAGTPKIATVLDRMRLTHSWLIGAGATTVFLTLGMAALVSVVFRSNS
ncbi:MAG TPA: hypothetical protein VG942_01310 [Hyphomonadaceae bacterium]|nr:hypothetical protein [Hyphomonadaceae bacterium]